MNDRFGTEVSKTSLNGSWKVSFYICSFEDTRGKRLDYSNRFLNLYDLTFFDK